MSNPACGSCGAPVADARLCTGCTRDLAVWLLRAADIAPDLDDAVARLLKRGAGGKRSGDENPLPLDLAASEAASGLRTSLALMKIAIRQPREITPEADIEPTARWLAGRLGRIRQHEGAATMLADLRNRVHRALAVIDRKPERVTAGRCESCGSELLAELGADTVTCRCGILASSLLARRADRAAAADVLGTAAEIHGALKAIGISIPRGTITSWASRGRLGTRGKAGLYALSDVLALHAQRRG